MKRTTSYYSLLNFLLGLFFIYLFWFQVVFSPINGMLPALGVLMIIVALLAGGGIIRLGDYKELFGFFLFTVYILTFGIIFSQDRGTTTTYIINHLKFMIPMIAICTYISSDLDRVNKIQGMIVFAVTLLCITAIISPTNSGGSITVNNLNPNTFASFLMIFETFCFLILIRKDTKPLIKIIMYFLIIIGFIMSIRVASRRGFIVYSFLFAACMYFLIRSKHKKNMAKKIIMGAFVIAIIVAVGLYLIENADSIRLFQRFAITNYQGDVLRKEFQNEAFKLFLKHPLFGTGLGYVGVYVGIYSHSLYYELLACTGLVGTIIMLGYLVHLVFFFLLSARKQHDEERKLRCYILATFTVSLLITGIASVLLYDMYFFLVISIIASERRILKKEN